MARGRRRDVDRLRGEFDDLFAELWQVPRFAGRRLEYRPQVDCFRTDDPPCLTLLVEIPGIEADDVQIVVSGRAIAVAGERRRPRDPKRVYQRMEIEYGPFRRELALSEDVDADGAQATYEHGILTVTLPLAQRPPRGVKVPIEVKSGS